MSRETEMLGVPRIGGPARPALSERTRQMCRALIARYPSAQSALLPMLYLVQAEHGFVSREGIRECGEMLGLTPAEVTAVATFYTMFKRDPSGKWLVSVCTQPPCALRGANDIKLALEQELGVKAVGETSEDGSVTLEEVECLCVCDGAPVVGLNYENYEGLTADQWVEIVRALREGGEPPAPKRGETPKPWAEAHRELSGYDGLLEREGPARG